VITAAIGVEAWRAWRVSRVAPREGGAVVELPDTVWNRILLPLERRGPLFLCLLTAAYAIAYVAVRIAGESRATFCLPGRAGGGLSRRETDAAQQPPGQA
jgi:hypothetical protein